MNYAIRVTHPKESTLFYDKLFENSSCVVIYRHVEKCKRNHFHGYVEAYKPSGKNTLANWIKKEYDVSGVDFECKTTYKSKESGIIGKVNRQFITYMSKGELEPEYYKGITKEEIDYWKSLWISAPTKIEHEVHLNHVEKKVTKYVKWDYINMAICKCVEIRAETGIVTYQEIFHVYKKILLEHKQKTGKGKMADDIYTIMINLGDFDSHLCNQVAKILGFGV